MVKTKRDKNNIDFVNDGYSTEELKLKIVEIRNKYNISNLKEKDITEELKNNISTEYKFFKERYPFLFDMVIKIDMDFDRLNYMLRMRENIVNNNITFENASKKVGQDMYDEYMK